MSGYLLIDYRLRCSIFNLKTYLWIQLCTFKLNCLFADKLLIVKYLLLGITFLKKFNMQLTQSRGQTRWPSVFNVCPCPISWPHKSRLCTEWCYFSWTCLSNVLVFYHTGLNSRIVEQLSLTPDCTRPAISLLMSPCCTPLCFPCSKMVIISSTPHLSKYCVTFTFLISHT